MVEEGKGRIVDLIDVSQNIPEKECDEIPRDAIITTINSIFSDGYDVIFVEGKGGAGKTNLLAQFARENPSRAVTLFLKAGCDYELDIRSIRWELVNQIKWYLDGKTLNYDDDPEDADLRKAIHLLTRKIRYENRCFYFIIDGIDQDESARTVSAVRYLLSVLPISINKIKVIFSGKESYFSGYMNKKIKSKALPLVPMSTSDIREYLSGCGLNDAEMLEVSKTCRGNPGELAAIKRILKSGASKEEIIENLPGHLSGVLDIEWEKAGINDDASATIVAALALSSRHDNASALSSLLRLDVSVIEETIGRCSFIEKKGEKFSFVSNAFLKYAKQRSQRYKKLIAENEIEELSREGDESINIRMMPTLLEEKGDFKSLVRLLNDEHFSALVRNERAIHPLISHLDMGIKHCETLEDKARFSLMRSGIVTVNEVSSSKNELLAYLALDMEEKARHVADEAYLAEDRLYLKSVIASQKEDWEGDDQDDFGEHLTVLVNSIDFNMISDERLEEIATNLFSSFPETSMVIMEKINKSESGKSNFDEVYARLSFSAIEKSKNDSSSDVINKIKSKLKSRRLEKIITAAERMTKTRNAGDIINLAKAMESGVHRIGFLRLWCKNCGDFCDTSEIVEYALECAVADAEFLADASFYRDISEAFPYMVDEDKFVKIVNLIDGQRTLISEKGPTFEHVRLQLSIARQEKERSLNSWKNRVIDLYLENCDIEDPVVRVSVLASIFSSINNIDKDGELEVVDYLHTLVEGDFGEAIQEALNSTADHVDALSRAVTEISVCMPERAIEIVKMLNTRDRRDEVFGLLLSRFLDEEKLDHWEHIKACLDMVSSKPLIDELVYDVCSKIREVSEEKLSTDLDYWYSKSREIYAPSLRAKSLCMLQIALSHQEESISEQAREAFEKDVDDALDRIDKPGVRIETAFMISSSLAKEGISSARKYLDYAIENKNENRIECNDLASVRTMAVSTAVKSFTILVKAHKESDADLARTTETIKSVPSDMQRAVYWTLVGLAYYLSGRVELAQRVFRTEVEKIINELESRNKAAYSRTLSCAGPLYWIYHPATAIEKTKALDWPWRDDAMCNIASFILRKSMPDEPYDPHCADVHSLAYPEIMDILSLIRNIESDSSSYHYFSKVADSVRKSFYKDRSLTKEQLQRITSEMDVFASSKFPSPEFIDHKGYEIVSKSKIASLRNEDFPVWENLLQEADAIPNCSDRVYVKIVIAENITAKHRRRFKNLWHDIKSEVDKVVATADRISRLQALAQACWEFDLHLGKQCLKEGLTVDADSGTESALARQRDLIDVTYMLDPELYENLRGLWDKDPSNRRVEARMKRHAKVHEAAAGLMKEKSALEIINSNKSEMANIAFKRLGMLNARRSPPLDIGKIGQLFSCVSDLSSYEAYPVMLWIQESVFQKYSQSPVFEEYARSIFSATFSAVMFIDSFCEVVIGARRPSVDFMPHGHGSEAISVKPGDREKAIDFIIGWFESSGEERIVVCDPYFSPDGLEVIRRMLLLRPDTHVTVMSGYGDLHDEEQSENKYKAAWSKRAGPGLGAGVDMLLLGVEDSKSCPIHDRWILGENSGLRLGTSLHSLGIGKLSEISKLSHREAGLHLATLLDYQLRRTRMVDGRRIQFSSFSL